MIRNDTREKLLTFGYVPYAMNSMWSSRVNGKCNRLIVLDINVDEESDTEIGEGNGDDMDNGKQEIDENDYYSSGNEDSDLRKIVDTDWYIILFIFCLFVFDFMVI